MLLPDILNNILYVVSTLTRIFTEIPLPIKNVTIIYTLFTPQHPKPRVIHNIEKLSINTDHELKILCHGSLNGNYSTQWYNYTIREYMKKGGITVMTTNYEYIMANTKSHDAIKYANYIGIQIGKIILKLHKVKGIKLKKFHIIGHLLGAHVAGVAGKTVYKETGKCIDRITGLDPTNQGLLRLYADGRLNRNDAVFVDAIHTNIGIYQESFGKIDFIGYAYLVKCPYDWYTNKRMGPIYYANSINNVDPMIGTKCTKGKYDSESVHCNTNVTAYLGEHVSRDGFGKFYLKKSEMSKYVCQMKNVQKRANNGIRTGVN